MMGHISLPPTPDQVSKVLLNSKECDNNFIKLRFIPFTSNYSCTPLSALMTPYSHPLPPIVPKWIPTAHPICVISVASESCKANPLMVGVFRVRP